ncbi:MAG TPA: hypothetical protein ENI76_09375 [Ignavibacteria bacterium]|nr:hypothetical protein [Ignavibacteria bacterium]
MDKEIWGIIGVVIGFLGKGIIDLILSRRSHEHKEKMYRLENQDKENVKEILLDMLNHRKFISRNFDTLKKRIGGFSDDEIRRILMEIKAQKLSNPKDNKEKWLLKDRIKELDTRANKHKT